MLIAMGIASFLCIYLGINYGVLYDLVPFPETAALYQPYTFDHIVGQMQLLLGAVFAFAFLLRIGAYPAEKRMINLDFDWVYRRFGMNTMRWSAKMLDRMVSSFTNVVARKKKKIGSKMHEVFSPIGALSRDIPSGVLAIWTSALLAIVLVIAYISP